MKQGTLLLVFCILISPIFSQDQTEFPQRKLTIYPTDEKITIDGILDEDLWKTATKHGDFYKNQPIDGEFANQQTYVQIAYDKSNIYIAATIMDDDNYVVNTLKRDQFGDSDAFAIAIDPQNQRANGFAFGVNAMGAATEALILGDDGDESWDNKWWVETNNHKDHWIVELAIPLKTLRFKSDQKTWAINFIRVDPGLNEVHVWSPVPRQFDVIDLGYYGEMEWEEAPKTQGKNIALIPYVSAAMNQDFNAENTEPKLDLNLGGDAKFALTTNLNLDLTFNPDFSQVDVDRQVTNLTRFNIFFPERRQFFVENADIFNSYGQFANSPFYSRRIGLDENGNTVPILAGARLTGNVNQKLRVGLLSMQTANTDNVYGQNYSAISFQQAIGARSNIKGLFLNRQAFNQSESIRGDFGRNGGGELNLISKDGVIRGQLGYIHSFKEGISDKNNHIYGRFDYVGQKFRAFAFIQNLGENYYADMGFNARLINYDPINDEIVRIGYTQLGSMIDYYIFPESEKVNFHWSGLENFVIVNEGGLLNEWYTRLRHFIFFQNTSQLRFRLNNLFVDLVYPFPITEEPLPAGDYNMTEFNIQYLSDQRKLLNYELFTVYGQFYNGTKFTSQAGINYRIQPWARFNVGMEYNGIRLPEPYGSLDLWLLRGFVEINFSRKIFWTTFTQYNAQNNFFNLNTRLQYRYAPMSDLFLVYTDNYLVDGMFGPRSRSLVLKVNYWLGI